MPVIDNAFIIFIIFILIVAVLIILGIIGDYVMEAIAKRSRLSDSYITYQIRKFIIYLDKHYIITDEDGNSVNARDILESWEEEK